MSFSERNSRPHIQISNNSNFVHFDISFRVRSCQLNENELLIFNPWCVDEDTKTTFTRFSCTQLSECFVICGTADLSRCELVLFSTSDWHFNKIFLYILNLHRLNHTAIVI